MSIWRWIRFNWTHTLSYAFEFWFCFWRWKKEGYYRFIHYRFLYHRAFDHITHAMPATQILHAGRGCCIFTSRSIGEMWVSREPPTDIDFIIMLAAYRCGAVAASQWLCSDLWKLVENIYALWLLPVLGFHKQYPSIRISDEIIIIYLFIYAAATTFLCLCLHSARVPSDR